MYCKLEEEALDRSLWRTGFGGGYAPVVRKTTYWWWWLSWNIAYVILVICSSLVQE